MQTLRNTLKYNAAFSILSSSMMLLFNSQLMSWMQITEPLALPIVGTAVLLFGGYVLWVALRKTWVPALVKSIIVLDITWVVASLLVVITNMFGLSPLGIGLVLGVAAIVGLFAFLQIGGMRRGGTSWEA